MVVAARRAMWGPITGVVFVVLLVASFFVNSSTPSSSDSGAKVIAYYLKQSNKRSANISALIIDISVVVGLFFFGYLRARLRDTDIGARLAPVAFAGAVIFAISGLGAAGTTFSLTDTPKHLAPDAAQALNLLNQDLFFPTLTIGIAVLALATGIIIVKSKMLPRWLGWLSIVIGVVGMAGPFGFFAFLAAPIWFLILCGFFYRDESRVAVPKASDPAVETTGLAS
jgi:Domain of unknown function (DUF4386)